MADANFTPGADSQVADPVAEAKAYCSMIATLEGAHQRTRRLYVNTTIVAAVAFCALLSFLFWLTRHGSTELTKLLLPSIANALPILGGAISVDRIGTANKQLGFLQGAAKVANDPPIPPNIRSLLDIGLNHAAEAL